MTHPEYCNSLVAELVEANAQLDLYWREIQLSNDSQFRDAVKVLYASELLNLESLNRRWGDAVMQNPAAFAYAPVQFEDAEDAEEV